MGVSVTQSSRTVGAPPPASATGKVWTTVRTPRPPTRVSTAPVFFFFQRRFSARVGRLDGSREREADKTGPGRAGFKKNERLRLVCFCVLRREAAPLLRRRRASPRGGKDNAVFATHRRRARAAKKKKKKKHPSRKASYGFVSSGAGRASVVKGGAVSPRRWEDNAVFWHSSAARRPERGSSGNKTMRAVSRGFARIRVWRRRRRRIPKKPKKRITHPSAVPSAAARGSSAPARPRDAR